MEGISEAVWQLYGARLAACHPAWKLVTCTSPDGCATWRKFIQAYAASQARVQCYAASEPCEKVKAASYTCAVVVVRRADEEPMAAVHLKVLSGPEGRYGSVDSCTIPSFEGRGLNKILRTLVYHALVTQFHCKLLYTVAVSQTTAHVVTKYFGWERLSDDSDLSASIAGIEGDLADYYALYDIRSPAYALLIERYAALCEVPVRRDKSRSLRRKRL
jgi:hypothetical protein